MKKAKILLVLGATSASFSLSGCGVMNPGTVGAALGTVSQLATTAGNVANLANTLRSPGGGAPSTAPVAAATGTAQLANALAANFRQPVPSLEGGTPGLTLDASYPSDVWVAALETGSGNLSVPRVQKPAVEVANLSTIKTPSTDLLGASRRRAEDESDVARRRYEQELVAPGPGAPGLKATRDEIQGKQDAERKKFEAEMDKELTKIRMRQTEEMAKDPAIKAIVKEREESGSL